MVSPASSRMSRSQWCRSFASGLIVLRQRLSNNISQHFRQKKKKKTDVSKNVLGEEVFMGIGGRQEGGKEAPVAYRGPRHRGRSGHQIPVPTLSEAETK